VLSRRHLLAATLGVPSLAWAQEDGAPRRVILDASRALQAGNADRFIGYFDKRRFGGLTALRRAVTALLQNRTVASSVDVVSLTDAANGKVAQVDWILQFTPIAGPGQEETRRETVELRLSQDPSSAWRIASFDPVEFFRVL